MYAQCVTMPGVTAEQSATVDAAVLALTGGHLPDGCRAHVAGPCEGGWRFIEVWESEEHLRRFESTVLGQAMQQVQAQLAALPGTLTRSPFDVLAVAGASAVPAVAPA